MRHFNLGGTTQRIYVFIVRYLLVREKFCPSIASFIITITELVGSRKQIWFMKSDVFLKLTNALFLQCG